MASYLEGKDGWLFLDDDTNNTWRQFSGDIVLDEDDIGAWQSELRRRISVFDSLNVAYRLVVAPNKESLLPEYLPDGYARGRRTILDQIDEICNNNDFYLNLRNFFLRRSDRDKLYPKTDTHWNDFGGLLASRFLLSSLPGFFAGSFLQDHDIQTRPLEGLGDLGDKCHPIRKEIINFWDFNRPHNSRLVYTNGILNHGKVEIHEGGLQNGISMVIFGDSFSGRIVHWLRECVARLVWVHSTAVDLSIIVQERPSVVLSIIVERFLVRPPLSCVDYSFKNDVLAKIDKTKTLLLENAEDNRFYRNISAEAHLRKLLSV